MSNIIIIDDDDRVRRQMEMFLAELGEDNRIRSFKTLKEFESVYFRVANTVPVNAPFPDHPQLRTLAIDQQAWLLEQKIPTEAPFPFAVLKIEINPDSGKVLKIEPQPKDDINLFGIPLEEFKLQNKVLESMLPTAFQGSFSQILEKAKLGKPVQTLMAFLSNTKEAWVTEIKLSKTPQGILISIEDLTPKLSGSIQAVKDKNTDTSGGEEDEELKLLSEIDLVIVKSNFMPKKPLPWFNEFHVNLKKFNLYSKEFRTRLVVTKYEDDGLEKVDVLHPLVDDIFFLPLDRLIFLQKVEIILGLPKQTSPSFLFSQEVKLQIEIAKRTSMEKMSDIALAIRNPVPLLPGLIGHFFIDLPSEKDSIEVYGKVTKSEPHPEHPGEFLVYFGYFGISKDIQTKMRRHLSKDADYKIFVNEDESEFAYNPDNLFLTDEDKRIKNIIVIDGDQESYNHTLDILREDIEQVQVAAFNTYSGFLQKYFGTTEEKPIDLAKLMPALPKEVFGGQALWIVTKEEKDLVDYSPPSQADATLLGHGVDEVFKEKQGWKILFGPEHESLLEEAIQVVTGNRPFQSIVFFTDKEGKSKALDLKAVLQARGIQFTLSIPKQEDLKNFILMQSKFGNWDLVLMDGALLPPDPADWIQNMETNARARGYLKETEQLKLIIIDSAANKRSAGSLKMTQVRAMLMRPIEPRSLVFNVSTALDIPHTIYRFNNLGWSTPKIPIQVAKEVQLQHLAEFGAAIRHARPIAPGTFLFLRGFIFDSAPRKNLCARFYACEEDPAEKGAYICSLTYFGINEAFTKFARTWFRESYAASKQTEGQ